MAVRAGDGDGRAVVGALLRALVVLGLVAMHQLGGGLHTAHAAPVHTASAHGAPPPAGHHAQPELSATPHPPGPSAAPSAPHSAAAADRPGAASWSAASATDSAVLVCLAVLLAGLLLTLSRTGRRATAARTCSPGAAPATAPLGRGPPRLLLARLCVLRV